MITKYFSALLVALTISILSFLPNAIPTQAADVPAGLTNVTLWIYPEYDDPRVLTMLEGKITGITTPAPIKFLVPTAAEMYSAGSKDAQGNYSGGPPDRTASSISGWDEISYELKNSTFRVEYYDPIITGQISKNISYDFRSPYPVSSLEVVIQVPTTATNFSVIPPGTKTLEGNFTVYTSRYTNLLAEQPLHFDITYTKSDPNPSLGKSPVTSTSSGTWSALPIVILGVVILVAIAFIGILVYAKKSKKVAIAASPRIHTGQRKSKQLPSKYCNQCGKPLGLPSKFCPYCRNKLDT